MRTGTRRQPAMPTRNTVSIMEFRNGKVVHETQYFADPFEAPAWRSQWVQQIASYDSADAILIPSDESNS